MKQKLFGLAAAAAVSLTLLTGCPAEETKETTTTTTTTTEGASPVASAEGSMGAASPAAPDASPTAKGAQVVASPAVPGGRPGGTTAPMASAAAGSSPAASTVDAKAIFSQKCAGCHGANGGGGMGPALTNVEARGDAFIKNRILKGSPEKGMPAFEAQLKPAEVDALVAYAKTL